MSSRTYIIDYSRPPRAVAHALNFKINPARAKPDAEDTYELDINLEDGYILVGQGERTARREYHTAGPPSPAVHIDASNSGLPTLKTKRPPIARKVSAGHANPPLGSISPTCSGFRFPDLCDISPVSPSSPGTSSAARSRFEALMKNIKARELAAIAKENRASAITTPQKPLITPARPSYSKPTNSLMTPLKLTITSEKPVRAPAVRKSPLSTPTRIERTPTKVIVTPTSSPQAKPVLLVDTDRVSNIPTPPLTPRSLDTHAPRTPSSPLTPSSMHRVPILTTPTPIQGAVPPDKPVLCVHTEDVYSIPSPPQSPGSAPSIDSPRTPVTPRSPASPGRGIFRPSGRLPKRSPIPVWPAEYHTDKAAPSA